MNIAERELVQRHHDGQPDEGVAQADVAAAEDRQDEREQHGQDRDHRAVAQVLRQAGVVGDEGPQAAATKASVRAAAASTLARWRRSGWVFVMVLPPDRNHLTALKSYAVNAMLSSVCGHPYGAGTGEPE